MREGRPVRGIPPHRRNARQGDRVDKRVVANMQDELHRVAQRDTAPPLFGQVDALLQTQAWPLAGGALQKGDIVARSHAELGLSGHAVQPDLQAIRRKRGERDADDAQPLAVPERWRRRHTGAAAEKPLACTPTSYQHPR